MCVCVYLCPGDGLPGAGRHQHRGLIRTPRGRIRRTGARVCVCCPVCSPQSHACVGSCSVFAVLRIPGAMPHGRGAHWERISSRVCACVCLQWSEVYAMDMFQSVFKPAVSDAVCSASPVVAIDFTVCAGIVERRRGAVIPPPHPGTRCVCVCVCVCVCHSESKFDFECVCCRLYVCRQHVRRCRHAARVSGPGAHQRRLLQKQGTRGFHTVIELGSVCVSLLRDSNEHNRHTWPLPAGICSRKPSSSAQFHFAVIGTPTP